jgi:hypothetical protein
MLVMVPSLLQVDDMNVRITNSNNSHSNTKVEENMRGKSSSLIKCGNTLHLFQVAQEVVGIREEEGIIRNNTLKSEYQIQHTEYQI